MRPYPPHQHRRRLSLLATAVTLIVFALSFTLPAADPTPAAQDKGADRNVSPQERQANGLREALDVADDAEWNALLPKVMKVQAVVRQAKDLRDPRRSLDRIRARQNDSSEPIPSALLDLADRAAELRDVWKDPNVPAAYVQRTLKLYREARVKADKQLAEDLAAARSQLRDLVTTRQELTLIMAGLLD